MKAEQVIAQKRIFMRYVVKQLFVLERKYKQKIRSSKWFAAMANRFLFSFRAQPLARGMAIGLFWMSIPMPFQMVPAALFCTLFSANLPIALLAVWVSNPFTYLPIFYIEYHIGAMLFGSDVMFSFDEFTSQYEKAASTAGALYYTILQGGLVLGIGLAVIGYLLAFPLARYMARFSKWRLHYQD